MTFRSEPLVHTPKRNSAVHTEKMETKRLLRQAYYDEHVKKRPALLAGFQGADVNRHGLPHLHAREIARRRRQETV